MVTKSRFIFQVLDDCRERARYFSRHRKRSLAKVLSLPPGNKQSKTPTLVTKGVKTSAEKCKYYNNNNKSIIQAQQTNSSYNFNEDYIKIVYY